MTAPVSPAAPAAPASPAPVAPVDTGSAARAEVNSTQTIRQFTQELRSGLAEGKSLQDQLAARSTAADPAAAPEPAPDAAAPAPDPAAAPVEPVAGEPAPESTGDDPAPVADAAPAPDGEAGEPLVVEIPNRFPNQAPLQIEVDSQETAERLRYLVNNGMRRTEYEQAMEQVKAAEVQRDEFMLSLRADPVSLISSELPPEARAFMALSVITDPEVWSLVAEDVLAFRDEQTLRLARAELEAERGKMRDTARSTIETHKAVQKNLADIGKMVERLVPPGLTDSQREFFIRDAYNDLALEAERQNIQVLPLQHVPELLAPRLRAYGLNDEQIRAALAGQRPSAPARPTVSTPAAPASATMPPATPANNGQRSPQQVARARKVMASMAPANAAGTPTTAAVHPVAPPKGATLKEAMAHARGLKGLTR